MAHRRRWLKRLSFPTIEARIIERASAVHYTSEQERREATEVGARGHPVVIPLGIDVNPYTHLPDPSRFFDCFPALAGRRIVLFLSRLDTIKGLDLLFEAFAQVAHTYPDAALAIVGDGNGSFIKALHCKADQLGISERIVWPGFLADEAKLAALAASELFVLPSYSENFGVAAVEAMAAGLPVILSDRVAIASDVQARGAGLVTACSVSALVSALDSLLGDNTLRERLGERARRLVSERFSLDAMSTQLSQLYAAQTAGSPASRAA